MFFYAQSKVTTSLSIAVLINPYYFFTLITKCNARLLKQSYAYKNKHLIAPFSNNANANSAN
ncbi:hypothetical protein VCHA47P369_60351 [Vibrio chagasii]|nr:hypothetical protein VCHA27O13_150071 [Vibrio chagasii]CAH6799564.1 hypothetical protein VCHA32P90_110103 [Vibrio chagasii]CAH6801132.1 hypothetical protein VCHA34P129_110073 [Vibrio chagasii]CAH6821726.1 hypothetical protein VCHA34O109_130129 [Vibrio chagasii]CAH6824477.1 hypothetical protein VCHA30O60_170027 [Vibrio chagasii]